MQENLEGYLPLVQTLLTRASYDKLSVIACCALMMAVSNFHLAKYQVCINYNSKPLWGFRCIVILCYSMSLRGFHLNHWIQKGSAELQIWEHLSVYLIFAAASFVWSTLPCTCMFSENQSLTLCTWLLEAPVLSDSHCLVCFQKTKASHCVLDYWKHLFCLTHPDSSCTAELLVHISPCTFQSPEQGYLR